MSHAKGNSLVFVRNVKTDFVHVFGFTGERLRLYHQIRFPETCKKFDTLGKSKIRFDVFKGFSDNFRQFKDQSGIFQFREDGGKELLLPLDTTEVSRRIGPKPHEL